MLRSHKIQNIYTKAKPFKKTAENSEFGFSAARLFADSVIMTEDIHIGSRFWSRVLDVFLAELYMDFIPRWFKKPDIKLAKRQVTAVVAGLSAALKFGIGIGLYPLSTSLNLGNYESLIRGLSIYLVVDGIYQLFDLRYLYSEGVRRAAILALDLFTYPFYVALLRSHRAKVSRRK